MWYYIVVFNLNKQMRLKTYFRSADGECLSGCNILDALYILNYNKITKKKHFNDFY